MTVAPDLVVAPDRVLPRAVAAGGLRFALRRTDPSRRRRNPATLMLHGVPDDGRTFAGLAELLRPDRVTLRPDLPGLGGSELRGPYDVTTGAERLAALVLHETDGLPGDGRVDVVGHDWGGILGLALAAARPDLVRRVVVVNAPYRWLSLARAFYVVLLTVPALPEVAVRVAGPRLPVRLVRQGWAAEAPLPTDLLDAAGGYAAPERTAAMAGYYRATVGPGGLRAAMSADVAVERALVVWGARDPVLPMSVAAATMRDLQVGTPDTRQLTVPGVGHWPHLAAPAAVLPAIAAFLRDA